MKNIIFCCMLFALSIGFTLTALGEEEYDFSEIDRVMNGENDMEYTFSEVFEDIVYGEGNIINNLVQALKNKVRFEINHNKSNIIKVIVLAILMGLLSNVAGAISSNSSEMTFYVIFMMLAATLLSSFFVIQNVVYELIDDIVSFMTVLIPVFFTSIGISSGFDTSVAMSGLTISGITMVQYLFKKVFIPLSNVYVVISLVNLITKECYFSKFASMLEEFLKWGLKTILTVFIGLNLVEGLVLPSKNTLVRRGVTKIASAVPIVGNGVSGVAELAVSSGEAIKNSIGGVALIALLIVALVPLVKILIFMGVYKVTAVIVEPICDKRVSTAVSCVANGGALLYKIAVTSLLLFGASIAVICVVTKQ